MNRIIRAMETMFFTPGFCHCLMHFVWFRMHLGWKGDCKLRAEFDALMTYLHDASLEAGTQKTPEGKLAAAGLWILSMSLPAFFMVQPLS